MFIMYSKFLKSKFIVIIALFNHLELGANRDHLERGPLEYALDPLKIDFDTPLWKTVHPPLAFTDCTS